MSAIPEVTLPGNQSSLGPPSGLDLNNSFDEPYYPTVKQPVHMIVIYSVAYSVVFIVGILGNGLVVTVVYRNAHMHNATNYFIVNLAIADILVLVFCLPFTLLHNIFSGWHFGAVMCKLIPYMQGISVNASVNTMAALAFDRYLAICHVLQFRMTRRVARLVIVLIWTIAGTLLAPWLVYYEQRGYTTPLQTIHICGQFWASEAQRNGYFLGVVFVSCFSVPLVLITVFYALITWKVWHRKAPGITSASKVIYESKVKVLKMLVVVVVLFAAFWIPLYGVNIRLYLATALDPAGTEFYIMTQTIVPICQWLGSSNSCVNPIIYCLFSLKFRTGFADLIGYCCWCSGSKQRRRSRPRSGCCDLLEPYQSTSPTRGTFHSSVYGSIVASAVDGRGNGFEMSGVGKEAVVVREGECRSRGLLFTMVGRRQSTTHGRNGPVAL